MMVSSCGEFGLATIEHLVEPSNTGTAMAGF
ncbi:MAG: hypothetical protein ACD_34C00010G0001 [uncultured bacterium]|nr:MAG: hypothetical protein ACD_34C00010G0001 [uncultured bacterium]